MRVELTWPEIMQAAHVGIMRRVESFRDGLKDRHGFNGDPWATDIQAAAAELAVAKVLNRYWCGSVNTFRGADVTGLQVRWTRTRKLIVRPGDADDSKFVLVTGEIPIFDVMGWMLGRDAKERRWQSEPTEDRPSCFMVPPEQLNSMDWIE